MSGASFTEKVLRVTVQMATGNAGDNTYGETIEITGLRMLTSIVRFSAPSLNSADIRIYGMNESLMNRCSTLGATVIANVVGRNNIVSIYAGDVSGQSFVFKGTVRSAFQNLEDLPDTSFTFNLLAGAFDAVNPTPPTSYRGAVDAATIIAGLANSINRKMENNGVSVILFNPYLTGTALEQIHEVCRQANIEMADTGETIAIWTKTGYRQGPMPLISPRTGLIGYPRYSDSGMTFRTLYNPIITVGGNVQVESGLARASGFWQILGMTYNLSCLVPNGPWFCDCSAIPVYGVGPVHPSS